MFGSNKTEFLAEIEEKRTRINDEIEFAIREGREKNLARPKKYMVSVTPPKFLDEKNNIQQSQKLIGD